MSLLVARWSRVMPAVAYMLVIFFLGSLPPGNEVAPRLNDKLLHALGFAFLVPLNWLAASALLVAWAPRARLVSAAAVAIAVGGLLEVHQLFFTRRSAEFMDWLADILGIVVAAALLAAFLAWRPVAAAPTSEP